VEGNETVKTGSEQKWKFELSLQNPSYDIHVNAENTFSFISWAKKTNI